LERPDRRLVSWQRPGSAPTHEGDAHGLILADQERFNRDWLAFARR